MSVSTKARLIQQATNTPPYTPLPPWVTLAAFSAREAAWAGLPGDTSPPGVDEDLPADLFSGGGAVLLHAAAAGGGDAAAQVQGRRCAAVETP